MIYRYPAGAPLRYEYTARFEKSKQLFREDMLDDRDIILVEGSLDCIWLHQLGWRGALATLGIMVSDWQVRRLSLIADSVTLMFDNDEAGSAGTQRAVAKLTTPVFVARYSRAFKDPQACPTEEVHRALRERVSANRWLAEGGLNEGKLQ
jgi:DNA primase